MKLDAVKELLIEGFKDTRTVFVRWSRKAGRPVAKKRDMASYYKRRSNYMKNKAKKATYQKAYRNKPRFLKAKIRSKRRHERYGSVYNMYKRK
jgi:hypothetical protein